MYSLPNKPIHISEFDQFDLMDLFDNQLHDDQRYLYPLDSQESIESAVARRFRNLRENAAHITVVDGAFDVPHNNHEWYLRHCKMIGAFAAIKTAEGSHVTFADFAAHIQRDSSFVDRCKLAATVDADEKVAFKKSGVSHKGGIERPIYPWQARADRLAGYHFTLGDTLHQTVDLVAVEGDSLHAGSPLESSLALAAFLQSEDLLDTFIIYGEHDETVQEAEYLSLHPVIITDGVPYENNPQTGKGWSSSQIIRRAQGQAVENPITRPASSMLMPRGSSGRL